MSIYYINPTISVNEINFNNIMDNLTNNISQIFIYNKNIVNSYNYNLCLSSIIQILENYLKLYEFYVYGIENINIEIYNIKINVVIYISVNISKTFYNLQKSTWYEFYNGNINKNPIVYYGLNLNQRQELNLSIVNGNFYMYDNVNLDTDLLEHIYSQGIILKKKSCLCKNINCNENSDYIITVYWYKSI